MNTSTKIKGTVGLVAILIAAALSAQVYAPNFFHVEGTGRAVVPTGGSLDVESGGELDIESGGSLKLAGTAVSSTAAELNILDGVTSTEAEIDKVDGIAASAYLQVCDGISFTEDGSGTSYTGTIEIPAGALLTSLQFVSTVLWDGTSASLDIGDDDDANGWFAAVNLKATDLLVGEVLDISNAENWGGAQGVYLVAATGRKGRVTAGVDSGIYYGAASEIIGVVTPGAADGSAGRSFMSACYSVPTFTASTNA